MGTNNMTNAQFLFACISAVAAIVGAAWIFSQALARSRSSREEFQAKMLEAMTKAIEVVAAGRRLPEYDNLFQEGDRRMDELTRQTEFLQSANLQTQKDVAVQMHSLNNLKQRFEGTEYALNALREKLEEMPEKIVHLLRAPRD